MMNPRTPEVELPAVAEMPAETPRVGRGSSARPTEPSRATPPEREGARAGASLREPGACDERAAESFLFDDPYWDDAFDSYHNPTLRTCCRF
jgi:hypothetical protein